MYLIFLWYFYFALVELIIWHKTRQILRRIREQKISPLKLVDRVFCKSDKRKVQFQAVVSNTALPANRSKVLILGYPD